MPHQFTITDAAGATSATLACDCFVHQYGAIAAGRRAPHYPSDMTDAEWAQIKASMPVPAWLEGRGGRPEAYCHREMVDAVRYLVDNGSRARRLNRDHERRPDHHTQMVWWAGLITLTRKLAKERLHWPEFRPERLDPRQA